MHSDALLTPHVLVYRQRILRTRMLARQHRTRLETADGQERKIERAVQLTHLFERRTRWVWRVVVRELLVRCDVAVPCVAGEKQLLAIIL